MLVLNAILYAVSMMTRCQASIFSKLFWEKLFSEVSQQKSLKEKLLYTSPHYYIPYYIFYAKENNLL